MKHLLLTILVAAAAVPLLAGCRGSNRAAGGGAAGQVKPFYGPTEPFEQVVTQINANNERIPTLWARHQFEATIVDRERGRKNTVVGDGALLYKRPRGFVLKGVRPGMTLFEMGSTSDRYWFTLVPEADTMWWGKYENLYQPQVRDALKELMPIRPDLVLEVLGVGLFDTNFLQPPVPTMRFNHDRDAYMFVWNAPGLGRWWSAREVWYDRQTFLPELVLLFDEGGRVVLRAFLAKHEPVDTGDDTPAGERPLVATEYRLFFPDTGTSMWLALDDVTLDRDGRPTRRGIAFPREGAEGVANVIQIDQGADE